MMGHFNPSVSYPVKARVGVVSIGKNSATPLPLVRSAEAQIWPPRPHVGLVRLCDGWCAGLQAREGYFECNRLWVVEKPHDRFAASFLIVSAKWWLSEQVFFG